MKQTELVQRQQFAATEVTGQVEQIPSNKHSQSMWDLLRAYETVHTKSTLPEQTKDNLTKTNRCEPSGP